MSQPKLLRELKRRLVLEGCSEVQVHQAKTSHYRVKLLDPEGVSRVFTVASSPTNTDITVKNVLQDLKRTRRGHHV